MKKKMKVTAPDSVDFTLSVTMPLREWRELAGQLSERWPSWELSRAINDMVRQATREFVPAPDEAETAEEG